MKEADNIVSVSWSVSLWGDSGFVGRILELSTNRMEMSLEGMKIVLFRAKSHDLDTEADDLRAE